MASDTDFATLLTAMSHIIHARRLELRLSARDIQRAVGIDIGTVSLFERGKIGNPSLNTLCKLAIALQLPLETLLEPYCNSVKRTLEQS